MDTTDRAEIGRRLKEERQRLRLTQAEMGAHGGVTKTTQMNYESGMRAADTDYLSNIRGHGVDLLYVLTGQAANARATAGATHSVPWLQGDRATGGHAVQEPPVGYPPGGICVTEVWLARRRLDATSLRALRISGAGMQPSLNDGDVVIVDVADTEARSGFTFAVQLGAELMVRYLQYVPGGLLRVWSTNSAVQAFEVDPVKATDFRVLGRVVAAMHDF